MSTKTLSVMEYLALGIGIPLLLQHTGRSGKVILHGRLVVAFFEHFLAEQFPYQAGKTCVFFRCTDAGPSGDFFIKGNGNVFHATIIVQYEICIKLNSWNFKISIRLQFFRQEQFNMSVYPQITVLLWPVFRTKPGSI